MRVLDLFSGIGGFSLGLERAGMTTVAFCERDPYCQKVLKKHWPEIPIYDDIKELDATGLSVGVVCGGFPCQPFSVAGKRRGSEDDRALWPEMYRVIQECRPTWVLGENVAGFVSLGLEQSLSDLEAAGYQTQPFIIPACAVNAPHRRDRVWILARRQADPDADGSGLEGRNGAELRERAGERAAGQSGSQVVADSGGDGQLRGQEQDQLPAGGQPASLRDDDDGRTGGSWGLAASGERGRWESSGWWDVEPNVGRVVDGLPRRVDRLRVLGNAVVPQLVEVFGRFIMQVEGHGHADSEHQDGVRD